MIEFRKVTLPSGAILKVVPAPFAESKALYQAILSEVKTVNIELSMELPALFKDVFCIGFSSPKIEAALQKCFTRCLYNEQKISDDTFEPVAAREDYTTVCVEVTKENIGPFLKSLYAEFQTALKIAENYRA
jgi:hypothetical protein